MITNQRGSAEQKARYMHLVQHFYGPAVQIYVLPVRGAVWRV